MTPLQESAYLKIHEIYKTEKGKKFIQHLVRAFLPIDPWSRLLDTDKRCAITGKLGFSVNKYTEMTLPTVLLRARITINPDDKESVDEYNAIVRQVKEHWDLEEGENVMEDRQTFYSEKSDKVLCTPAIIALRDFAQDQMLRGDRDMSYTVKASMYASVDGVTKTQAKAAAKKSQGFKMSTHEVDAFKDLAQLFKDKQ